jgi:hypothetical protein
MEKAVTQSILCYGDVVAQSLGYETSKTTGTIPTSKFLVNVMEKHLLGWKMIVYQVAGKWKPVGDDKNVKEIRETTEETEDQEARIRRMPVCEM